MKPALESQQFAESPTRHGWTLEDYERLDTGWSVFEYSREALDEDHEPTTEYLRVALFQPWHVRQLGRDQAPNPLFA